MEAPPGRQTHGSGFGGDGHPAFPWCRIRPTCCSRASLRPSRLLFSGGWFPAAAALRSESVSPVRLLVPGGIASPPRHPSTPGAPWGLLPQPRHPCGAPGLGRSPRPPVMVKPWAKLQSLHVPFLCAATDLALGEELRGKSLSQGKGERGYFPPRPHMGMWCHPGLGEYPWGLGPHLWHEFRQLLPWYMVTCAVFLFAGPALQPPGNDFKFPSGPICANSFTSISPPR